MLPDDVRAFVDARRIGRLATVDGHGRPHAVPICFALDGHIIYSVLDEKPKSVPAASLRRVRNITANPAVQVLFDLYYEDWARLAYVQLRGSASILEPVDDAAEHAHALRLLRARYQQYRSMALEGSPIVRVQVESSHAWAPGGLAPEAPIGE